MISLRSNRFSRIFNILLPFFLGLVLVVSLPSILPSFAIPVSEVPNPRQANGSWVVDMADLLSSGSEEKLNAMISQLETVNGTEIAVVTVPDTQPSRSPKAFATDLFNQWGIGKQGVDNGLLFLVSKGDRRTEVETGYAIEAVLPDAKVGDILRSQVTPRFKTGDFDAGIVSGTETMVRLLQAETFSPPTSLDVVGRYSSWIFKGGMLSIGAGIAILSFKSEKKERYLQPTGQTKFQAIRPIGVSLIIGIHWLSGEGDLWANDISPQLSLAYDPNQSILKAWWQSLRIISIVLGLSFIALGLVVRMLLPMTLFWLGYEMYCSGQSKSKTTALQAMGIKLGSLSVFCCIFLFVPYLVFRLLDIPVLSLGLTAIFGAFARALTMKRSLTSPQHILCKRCALPMERLEPQELRSKLSKVEQISWRIHSCSYEGWRCPSCNVKDTKKGLDLHLFSQVVLPKKFEYCKDCDGWTVISKSKVHIPSTKDSIGSRVFLRYCACCEKETEKFKTIPRKVVPSSSSSSFSGSSGSSGNSYSGGSSGSSGNSYSGGSGFGGGSSGGGGAGDSW